MEQNCLLSEEREGVVYLTLNRPEKLNALDTAMFRAIDHALSQVKQREDIKVIVLKGAGKCFCAGHDVSTLGQPDQDEHFNSGVVARLADMKQAVVSVIHSHCYTGALELALASDIIIAGEGAKIGDTHAKFSLRPIWGLTQRLPRRIGVNRAKDMVFTSRVYRGEEAARIGLADYCFPDGELEERAEEIVRKICENSAKTIRFYKEMLRDTDGQNLSVGLEMERRIIGEPSGDFKEKAARFLNK